MFVRKSEWGTLALYLTLAKRFEFIITAIYSKLNMVQLLHSKLGRREW